VGVFLLKSTVCGGAVPLV